MLTHIMYHTYFNAFILQDQDKDDNNIIEVHNRTLYDIDEVRTISHELNTLLLN